MARYPCVESGRFALIWGKGTRRSFSSDVEFRDSGFGFKFEGVGFRVVRLRCP